MLELPLKNQKILVTRPMWQVEKLCRMIEEKGGIAIRFPVIDIVPPANKSIVIDMLSRLNNYHIAIFVSRNAVDQTLKLLGKKRSILASLELVAIGMGTAQELKYADFKNVIHASGLASSEALLEVKALQPSNISNKQVVILRGETGRELLANELYKRGARVENICVYQQLCPSYEKAFLKKIWTENIPHLVVVTSSQGLYNLFNILKPTYHSTLLLIPLLVFSRRTADLAIKLGFKKLPIIAKETSDQGILAATIERLMQ